MLRNKGFLSSIFRGVARGKTRLSGEGAQRAGLYARVSTQDQNTLPLQMAELTEYTKRRGSEARDRRDRRLASRPVGSFASRPHRNSQRVPQRRDRLCFTQKALDLTSAAGRALAGMLAVFAEFERDILRDRVKAGIAHARAQGRPHGRPVTIQSLIPKIRELAADGVSKRQIAATLGISRTSVRRLRTQTKRSAT